MTITTSIVIARFEHALNESGPVPGSAVIDKATLLAAVEALRAGELCD